MRKIYLYAIINYCGTYISYLAVVAVPSSKKHFIFNLGILFAARAIGNIGAYFIAHRLINKYSEKTCMVAANIVCSLALVCIIVEYEIVGFVATCLVIIGFCENILTTSLHGYNSRIQEKSQLLTINHNLQFLVYVTMILGASIGGSLVQYTNLKVAFGIDSASYLICGILALSLKTIVRPAITDSLSSQASSDSSKKEAIPNIVIRTLILNGIAGIITSTFMIVEIPFYLNHLHLSYSQIGPFFSVTILGLIAASYVIRKINLSNINMRLLIGFFSLYAIAFLLLSFAGSLAFGAFVILLFIGLSSILSSLTINIYQVSLPESLRAKYLSLNYSIGKIIYIAIVPIAGYFSDGFGIVEAIRYAFYIYVILQILMVVFMIAKARLLKERLS